MTLGMSNQGHGTHPTRMNCSITLKHFHQMNNWTKEACRTMRDILNEKLIKNWPRGLVTLGIRTTILPPEPSGWKMDPNMEQIINWRLKHITT